MPVTFTGSTRLTPNNDVVGALVGDRLVDVVDGGGNRPRAAHREQGGVIGCPLARVLVSAVRQGRQQVAMEQRVHGWEQARASVHSGADNRANRPLQGAR